MRTLHERKRQGEEICKQYRSISGADRYARAADAIADILLAIAEDEAEATKILQAAEVDYRGAIDAEGFFSEG